MMVSKLDHTPSLYRQRKINNNMDNIIEGMKFFDDSLSKKGKMTRDDFATCRRILRRSYQEEMDNLATEYAVRNSIYRVGDKVIVNDSCFANEPCRLQKWNRLQTNIRAPGIPSDRPYGRCNGPAYLPPSSGYCPR